MPYNHRDRGWSDTIQAKNSMDFWPNPVARGSKKERLSEEIFAADALHSRTMRVTFLLLSVTPFVGLGHPVCAMTWLP